MNGWMDGWMNEILMNRQLMSTYPWLFKHMVFLMCSCQQSNIFTSDNERVDAGNQRDLDCNTNNIANSVNTSQN